MGALSCAYSPEVIKTIPKYGVRFNFTPLEETTRPHNAWLPHLHEKFSPMVSDRQRLIHNILIFMIIVLVFIISAMA
ncbi:Uncharacterised protein [Serratia quinivorans]|uniref:hypothetical protein n=1 Tax=Serratia quinivorans TaxID=137545 RepID=UPI00217954BE|nr:hypothetical protein [Serratia quinivorans]CAI1019440.1 Uncharacterised protein [Serratia quinivorans]